MDTEQRDKKEYTAPRLVVHGDVEKLTTGLGGTAVDGFGGSRLKD